MFHINNYKRFFALLIFLLLCIILIVFHVSHERANRSTCNIEWSIWFEEREGRNRFNYRFKDDFNWKLANCSTAFLPISGLESSDVRHVTDKSGSLKATLILGLDSASNQGFISWFTYVPLKIKIKDKFQGNDILCIDAGDVSPDCGIRTFIVIKDGESYKLVPNPSTFVERKLGTDCNSSQSVPSISNSPCACPEDLK